MQFTLSQDDQMLLEMVQSFATSELAPHAAEWDHTQTYPSALWAQLAELSLFGVALPEVKGGVGMTALSAALVIEALAMGDPATALRCAHQMVVAEALALSPAPEAAAVLTELVQGQKTGAIASLESDIAYGIVKADGWLITHEQTLIWITAQETQVTPSTGIGCNAVEWVDLKAQTGGLALKVDPAAIHGTWARLTAAILIGAGQSAANAAVSYATERKQFGKTLSRFQAIQWMIADSATELDAARLLLRSAALSEELTESQAARHCAQKAALAATDRALQMHGGSGYTREYPVERLYRAARALV